MSEMLGITITIKCGLQSISVEANSYNELITKTLGHFEVSKETKLRMTEPDGGYLFIEDEDNFEYMEMLVVNANAEKPNWVPQIELIDPNGKLKTPNSAIERQESVIYSRAAPVMNNQMKMMLSDAAQKCNLVPRRKIKLNGQEEEKKAAETTSGQGLGETSQKLDTRGKVIKTKVDECNTQLADLKTKMQTTKGSALNSLKQSAMQVLRRRKMYDQQLGKLMNQQFKVDVSVDCHDDIKVLIEDLDSNHFGSTSNTAHLEQAQPGDPQPINIETHFEDLTYIRLDGDANLEILAYGASDDDSCFFFAEREDSVFKRPVRELESATNFVVWTAAEHIPASWTKLNVALYHIYHEGFDLVTARLVIRVAPQDKIKNSGMTEVYNEAFPEEGKEEEQLIREQVATITIPEDILAQGNYCLFIEVVAHGNEFNRCWGFEGIGLTQNH